LGCSEIDNNFWHNKFILRDKMKQILIALFALLILAIPSALAMTVTVKDFSSGPVSVEVGETIPIEVINTASVNISDVVVTAELAYNGKKVSVESKPFDMLAGTSYTKTLKLDVPENIKTTSSGNYYTLSVRMQDNDGNEIASQQFKLTVQRADDNLEIQKVMTTPANAGEPVIVTVVAKNIGADALEDVYVRVSIPDLNVVAEERMGDILATDKGEDEDVATRDVVLVIPDNAGFGDYALNVEVYDDDDNVFVSDTESIYINGVAPAEKFVEVVPTLASQSMDQGEKAAYTLRVANIGDTTKTFEVLVTGTEGWAAYDINPLSITLAPESSTLITVAVTAADKALTGEHKFTVKVKSNDAEKSIALTANVNEKAGGVDALMISVIVLAVVLVILVVILVKTRKADETAEAEESYY
jgi:uncharacterized membrane protein